MEFERAIFRVYERSIDSLIHEELPSTDRGNDSSAKKSCQIFELFLYFGAFCFYLCLISLHYTFVGNPGCLPSTLMVYNTTTNASFQYQLRKDDILGINIRNGQLRKWKSSSNGDDDYMINHWATGNIGMGFGYVSSHAIDASIALQQWAQYSFGSIFSAYSPKYKLFLEKFRSRSTQKLANIFSNSNSPFTTMEANSSTSGSNSTAVVESDYDHLLDFDYVVGFDEAVFLMNNEMLVKHHFRIINVTLSADECFGGSSLETLLGALNVFDLAIVNNVMYTAKIPGYLVSKYGSIYHWTHNHLHSNNTVSEWFCQKVSILFNSFVAFFFLSTTTTLLVRVLITSGVILIFPTFWLLRCCGVTGLHLRAVSVSYPWIGFPLQAIRAAGQSPYPFILAHLARVLVYYLLYVAAQSAYITWLYDDVTFGTVQLWLYVVMMLWEYFTMIYLRSATSIEFFPRISLLLFLLYHVYYYSFPSGFHLLALTVMSFLIMALMTHCVRVYEVKAYRQGLVSFEQPRMIYTNMPWPAWRYDIAPDYSIFMPMNSRANSVYLNTIPSRPNAEGRSATDNRGSPRETPTVVRPGADPMLGPFGRGLELSTLFRRRTATSTATNQASTSEAGPENSPHASANLNATNPAGGSRYTVMNSLFSQFFPSSEVANYQSLASTSLHESNNSSENESERSGETSSSTESALHQQIHSTDRENNI